MPGEQIRPSELAKRLGISRQLDRTDLKRSTKESYKFLVTKHSVPAFGKDSLDALVYSRLKGWVIEQAARYSKDSVRLMVAVLRAMLQEAVNEGILALNPGNAVGVDCGS